MALSVNRGAAAFCNGPRTSVGETRMRVRENHEGPGSWGRNGPSAPVPTLCADPNTRDSYPGRMCFAEDANRGMIQLLLIAAEAHWK